MLLFNYYVLLSSVLSLFVTLFFDFSETVSDKRVNWYILSGQFFLSTDSRQSRLSWFVNICLPLYAVLSVRIEEARDKSADFTDSPGCQQILCFLYSVFCVSSWTTADNIHSAVHNLIDRLLKKNEWICTHATSFHLYVVLYAEKTVIVPRTSVSCFCISEEQFAQNFFLDRVCWQCKFLGLRCNDLMKFPMHEWRFRNSQVE